MLRNFFFQVNEWSMVKNTYYVLESRLKRLILSLLASLYVETSGLALTFSFTFLTLGSSDDCLLDVCSFFSLAPVTKKIFIKKFVLNF